MTLLQFVLLVFNHLEDICIDLCSCRKSPQLPSLSSGTESVFKPSFRVDVRAEAVSWFGQNLCANADIGIERNRSVSSTYWFCQTKREVQISFTIPLSSLWCFWQPFSSWITAPLVSDALHRVLPTPVLWNKRGSCEVSWLPTGLSVAALSDNNMVFLFSLCCSLTSPCVTAEIKSAFCLLAWDSITALCIMKFRFTIISYNRTYSYILILLFLFLACFEMLYPLIINKVKYKFKNLFVLCSLIYVSVLSVSYHKNRV